MATATSRIMQSLPLYAVRLSTPRASSFSTTTLWPAAVRRSRKSSAMLVLPLKKRQTTYNCNQDITKQWSFLIGEDIVEAYLAGTPQMTTSGMAAAAYPRGSGRPPVSRMLSGRPGSTGTAQVCRIQLMSSLPWPQLGAAPAALCGLAVLLWQPANMPPSLRSPIQTRQMTSSQNFGAKIRVVGWRRFAGGRWRTASGTVDSAY